MTDRKLATFWSSWVCRVITPPDAMWSLLKAQLNWPVESSQTMWSPPYLTTAPDITLTTALFCTMTGLEHLLVCVLLSRKGGIYSDVLPLVLPLKAARRDSVSNLTSLGLRIWAAEKPKAVSFRVTVGRHINAAHRLCDGLGQNKIP